MNMDFGASLQHIYFDAAHHFVTGSEETGRIENGVGVNNAFAEIGSTNSDKLLTNQSKQT